MCRSHDVADLPVASCTDDPADHVLEAMCPRCGHPVDAICPECQGNVEASGAEEESEGRDPKASPREVEPAGDLNRESGYTSRGEGKAKAERRSCLTRTEFYRRLVLLIYNARNSKFMLGCYLLATDDGFADGVSMTEYAGAWGVTKATVSKQCRFICGYLGLHPSRYMRAEAVARGFRLSNRRPRKIGNVKREAGRL